MSTIEPYIGPTIVSRADRQVGRAVARIEAGARIRLTRLETEAEMQAAKLQAIGHVGRVAEQQVALLSQVEQTLAQTVPHASGRLATIADLTAISMSEVVAESGNRFGRL